MIDDAETPRVVFLDRETLSPETSLRAPAFPHRMEVFAKTAPAEVAERIRDAEIVITNKAPLRREAIAGARNLRLVAVAATGTDVVDVNACAERGVTVSNIRNYAVNTVPEHTFALIFALRRSIAAYRDAVDPGPVAGGGRSSASSTIRSATLPARRSGSSATASSAEPSRISGARFGMRVLFAAYKGVDRHGAALHAVRRGHADKRHHHASLPADALDPQHDRRARIRADGAPPASHQHGAWRTRRRSRRWSRRWTRGRSAGRVSMSSPQEPPPPDHPLMRIAARPNVILTPHVAWASQEAIQSLADQLIDNVEAFWSGRPRNVVAP